MFVGSSYKYVCGIFVESKPRTIRFRLALVDKCVLAAAAEVGGVEEVREEHKVRSVNGGATRTKGRCSQLGMLCAR